ncbi:MAG: uracil-DNA glycosylase [Pseudomonadota bacterium]|jgi:DNA polymerase|nr:uracil-DNA glycosylase [Pseudomonadota bacterium]|tara:strand:- start:3930 stop:4631 length:702 start_codon:yes stop_codon:yes gene_type:complete
MNGIRQHQYLKEIGITVWLERKLAGKETTGFNVKSVSKENRLLETELDKNLDYLSSQVQTCNFCELHKFRTKAVFGIGNKNADWLVIGEAPGVEEDLKGEPFVGRAGKLLNAMLLSMGLQRKEVFIANILKCRPPKNRDPKLDEVEACGNYLRQQIELIKPKVILALGRIAAQNLLKSTTPIGKMRGNSYLYPGSDLPVVVTYHPAYLLRSPTEKRKVWEDLKFAQNIFRGLI